MLGRPSVAESAQSIVDAAGILSTLPGVRFLSALRRGNVHGALDAGLAPGILPGRVSLDDGREWFAEGWGQAPEQRGLDTTGILRAAVDGELQALVLLGADPLGDFPDRALAKAALERVPFVVAVDTFLNESNRLADVVLPAATFAERPGTTTNLEGRISRLGQKITAPQVAWPDWMIAVELADRLGSDLGFISLEEIESEVERLAPAFAGLTADVLATRAHRDGVVLPLPATPVAVPEPEAETEPEADSDSELLAAENRPEERDAAAKTVERPALLSWRPTSEPVPAPKLDAYKLRLVAGRKLYDAGVMVSMAPSLAPLAAPPVVRLHPTDLERLGVASGGQVKLRASKLTVDSIEVEADPHQARGTAGVPFNVLGLDTASLLSADEAVVEIAIETR